MSTQKNTTAKAADKAQGKASAPAPAKAKGYVIADGHSITGRNGRLEPGTPITAADLKSTRDPSGEREFERQIKAGTLVPGKGARATETTDATETGTVDTGAGPSGAQVIAAETGNDPLAAAVVDAAAAGDQAKVEELNAKASE